ncbi:hypothetical protein RhiJN_16525 [Ceratobasidium sp. AG-Ba]|nr:hypothetical protein RhiJN_16525 [Ceratobasidium sp. AG-Ba]
MVLVPRRSKPAVLRRKSPHASRKRRSQAAAINLSVARQAAQKRRQDLGDAVESARTLVDGIIKRVAENKSLKESTLRQQVYRSVGRLETKRKPNAWNAFMHKIACEANEDQVTGNKLKANKLVTPEVRERYNNLTPEERVTLLDEFKAYRTSNETGHYITEKSDHHAALAKVKEVERLLVSLEHQHNIQFVFAAARGSMQSYFEPYVFITETASAFWNVSIPDKEDRWAQRLEGFCVGGVKELLAKDKLSNSDLLERIRDMLAQKLVQVTNDPKAKMVYARFEQDVVNKYGVVLEGWPFPTLRNLSDERPSNAKLMQLYRDLLESKCYFRKLTSEEIATRDAISIGPNTNRAKQPRGANMVATTSNSASGPNTLFNSLAPQVPQQWDSRVTLVA